MQPTTSYFSAILVMLGLGLVSLDADQHENSLKNSLTKQEIAEGWELLLDGISLAAWRNYQAEGIDEKWVITGGVLTLTAKGGGDLITREQFGAFELKIDWNISPGGNSGVMYHATEEGKKAWNTGPEIQINDHVEGKDQQKAGWLYQLYQSEVDAVNPPGEWNTLHIVITPEKCEHFMNGTKYFEYVKGSPEWDAKVAASKFSKHPDFGKPTRGHLVLQDHGKVVSYRNIKIRRLD